MTEPIPIYRFLDSHAALKTLEAGRFRVGSLSKFNDLFEWKLGFSGIITSKEQEIADKYNNDHQSWIEDWMGVMCFSDTASDPVLWSIYAEKHRGVAFEVEYAWNSKEENLFKMTYTNERPVLNFSKLRVLRKLILGFRCPLEESAVRKLLDSNGCVDTKIARAKMCSETYSIKC